MKLSNFLFLILFCEASYANSLEICLQTSATQTALQQIADVKPSKESLKKARDLIKSALTTDEILLLNSREFDAIIYTIAKKMEVNTPPPEKFLHIFMPYKSMTSDPGARLQALNNLISKKSSRMPFVNSRLQEMKPGRSKVPISKVTVSKKDYVFRPLYSSLDGVEVTHTDTVRKTMAASIFGNLIGVKAVPDSMLGFVNGETGVLTQFYGEAWARVQTWESAIQTQKTNSLTDVDASDVRTFAFLIGDGDTHFHNVHKAVGTTGQEAEKTIQLIDVDAGFIVGIPKIDVLTLTALPNTYSPDLLYRLVQLTREQLQATDLIHLLSADEIESLLFRRDIILSDAALRLH